MKNKGRGKIEREWGILVLQIEIINWDKYNPKRDQKEYTWLRLNNDSATDPELFGLSAEQKFAWIEILCQASRKNKGTLSLNLDQLAHICQVSVAKIKQLIEFLQVKPIIKVHDRARTPIVADTTPTYERTNDTNERKISLIADFDFEAVYKNYPRKVGKEKGIKSLKASIKTTEDFDALSKAILNYAKECELNATEPRFVKHFSSFVSVWRDFVDFIPADRSKAPTKKRDWSFLEKEFEGKK